MPNDEARIGRRALGDSGFVVPASFVIAHSSFSLPVPLSHAYRSGVSYTVFARKYRPQTFDEVVGQDHIVRTLKNAIDQNRLAQAYLFVGPRGTGKTTTARILAKALNCTGGPKADFDPNEEICREIADGRSMN